MVSVPPSGSATVAWVRRTEVTRMVSPFLAARRTTLVPRRTGCSGSRTRSGRCDSNTSPNVRLARTLSISLRSWARSEASATLSSNTSNSSAIFSPQSHGQRVERRRWQLRRARCNRTRRVCLSVSRHPRDQTGVRPSPHEQPSGTTGRGSAESASGCPQPQVAAACFLHRLWRCSSASPLPGW